MSAVFLLIFFVCAYFVYLFLKKKLIFPTVFAQMSFSFLYLVAAIFLIITRKEIFLSFFTFPHPTDAVLVYIFVFFINHVRALLCAPFSLKNRRSPNVKPPSYFRIFFKCVFYLFCVFTLLRYYAAEYELIVLLIIILIMSGEDFLFSKSGITQKLILSVSYIVYAIFLLMTHNFFSFVSLIIVENALESFRILLKKKGEW